MRRIIAHLDLDAFFASVEERDHPWLKGKPIVVGADPKEGNGRGVVSTANYKAREYGIHSGMPISRAWQLSEKAKRMGKESAIFLASSHGKYSKASERIMAIIKKYVPMREQASIDEIYMNLSPDALIGVPTLLRRRDFTKSFKNAEELCRKIKKEIKAKEKLTASVGIGPNKLIAKIASDQQKPDGLTMVTEKEAEKFLEPLSIRTIPGIGPKTEAILIRHGVKNIQDLKKYSKKELQKMFGKWGLNLYEKARGRDHSLVIEEHEIKSIGEQKTFDEDTLNVNFIVERLKSMCKSVLESVREEEFKGFRTVVITVRFADFETKTRTHTLPGHTNSLDTLQFEAFKLLMPFFDKRENPNGKRIRLIGARVEKLIV